MKNVRTSSIASSIISGFFLVASAISNDNFNFCDVALGLLLLIVSFIIICALLEVLQWIYGIYFNRGRTNLDYKSIVTEVKKLSEEIIENYQSICKMSGNIEYKIYLSKKIEYEIKEFYLRIEVLDSHIVSNKLIDPLVRRLVKDELSIEKEFIAYIEKEIQKSLP